MFQPIYKTFKIPAALTDTVVEWESKGRLNKNIKPAVTKNDSVSPRLKKMNDSTIKEEFKERCLKQDKETFTLRNAVNLFFVYELDTWSQDLNTNFYLKYSLFVAVNYKQAVLHKALVKTKTFIAISLGQ